MTGWSLVLSCVFGLTVFSGCENYPYVLPDALFDRVDTFKSSSQLGDRVTFSGHFSFRNPAPCNRTIECDQDPATTILATCQEVCRESFYGDSSYSIDIILVGLRDPKAVRRLILGSEPKRHFRNAFDPAVKIPANYRKFFSSLSPDDRTALFLEADGYQLKTDQVLLSRSLVLSERGPTVLEIAVEPVQGKSRAVFSALGSKFTIHRY